MTGAETGNLGILDPDYLRRMGESEQSIAYLRAGMDDDGRSGGIAAELEQVAARAGADAKAVPYTSPATETGD
jgi:hypothetical protein